MHIVKSYIHKTLINFNNNDQKYLLLTCKSCLVFKIEQLFVISESAEVNLVRSPINEQWFIIYE